MKKEEIQSVYEKLGIYDSKTKIMNYEDYELKDRELLYGAPIKKGERIIVKTNIKL